MVKYKQTRVKHAYDYNFIKMLYPELGQQKEKLGQRLETLINKNHLTVSQTAALCQIIAGKYGFRVTPADIRNYLSGVSPKTDKLAAICKTFGTSVPYLCGYGHSPFK